MDSRLRGNDTTPKPQKATPAYAKIALYCRKKASGSIIPIRYYLSKFEYSELPFSPFMALLNACF